MPLGQKTTITTDKRPSASRLGIPDHAQSPRPEGRRERVVKRTQRPWQADQHLRQRPLSRAGRELDCWVCDGREKGLTLPRGVTFWCSPELNRVRPSSVRHDTCSAPWRQVFNLSGS